jgi:hypothetical protein
MSVGIKRPKEMTTGYSRHGEVIYLVRRPWDAVVNFRRYSLLATPI